MTSIEPATFWDKGTTGQATNLTKGQEGLGQSKSGMGRMTKRDRAENDILKQSKTGKGCSKTENLVRNKKLQKMKLNKTENEFQT